MAVTSTLTLTSPDGTNTIVVHPVSISMPHAALNESAVLTAEIQHDFDQFADETDNSNPLATEAIARWIRDGTIEFDGKLKRVNRERLRNGELVLPIECADGWDILNYTLAGVSGERRFGVVTQELDQSDIAIVPGTADDDRAYPYFPTLSQASAWLPLTGDGAPPNLPLAGDIDASASSIVLTGDAHDWPPRGYGLIGAEGFHYDGRHKTNSSPEQWTLRNSTRGSLGTSAAAHSTLDDCYCKIPKRISASGEIKVEGYTGSAWELIGHGQYDIDQDDACFSFKGDPEASPYNAGSGYTSLRASWTNFDETHAAAVEAADILQALLEFDGDGGPDIDAGDINIDIPYLPVTRLRLTQSSATWPVIRRLLAEYLIDRANAADDIAYWFESTTGKYTIKQIAQAGTPDVVLDHCSRIHESVSGDQLYSGVLAGFRGKAPSLFSPSRFYMPDRGDSWGGQTVSAFMWQVCDRDMAEGWNEDTTSNGNDVRAQLLCDGNNNTGIGLKFGAAVSANTVMYYAWTPAAATKLTEHIRVVLDLRRFIKSTDCVIEVVGYTSYTPGDPPAASGLVHLSDLLRISFNDDQGNTGPGPVERVGMLGGRLVGSDWALSRGNVP